MKIWRLILLVIIILGLLVSGCSVRLEEGPADDNRVVTPPDDSVIKPAPDNGASTKPDDSAKLANLAPDFTLRNLDGEDVSLSDFRGKVVLLNFWASWCSPCVYEMPFLQEAYEEWQDDGLVILGINKGESVAKVERFAEDNGISFPILLDGDEAVSQRYGVRSIPASVLIDKDGFGVVGVLGPFLSKASVGKLLEDYSLLPAG
ncbi:peroxiredoxin family protein [Chloroflexota bacterium]